MQEARNQPQELAQPKGKKRYRYALPSFWADELVELWHLPRLQATTRPGTAARE